MFQAPQTENGILFTLIVENPPTSGGKIELSEHDNVFLFDRVIGILQGISARPQPCANRVILPTKLCSRMSLLKRQHTVTGLCSGGVKSDKYYPYGSGCAPRRDET